LKRKPTYQISPVNVFILVELHVTNYEEAINLKTQLEVFFRVALQTSSLLHILRFTYLQQFRLAAREEGAVLLQLFSGGVFLRNGVAFKGYEVDLVPSQKRPTFPTEEFYQNIPWTTLKNQTTSSDTSEETASSNEVWYMHLLILTSEMDSGDIALLILLPIAILFGVYSLFKTYQTVHDKVINEMGYEIHYDYTSVIGVNEDDEEQDGSRSNSQGRQNSGGNGRVELSPYSKSSGS
jgi:hypothetical protein